MAKHEHTMGGSTTRDATDLGVPMAPAPAGYTHQGPEDALDPTSRGDYRGRIGDSQYQPHTIERVERGYGEEPEIHVVKQEPTGPGGADDGE